MTHKLMGKKAKDKLTGFTGTITAHAEYMTGCDQFLLQPPVKDGSEYVNPIWFDEQRLEIEEGDTIKLDNSNGNGACGVAPIK